MQLGIDRWPYTVRMLVRPQKSQVETSIADMVSGRSYSMPFNSVLDVPEVDAARLEGLGWVRLALSGPGSARPTTRASWADPYGREIAPGFRYYDDTVGKLVVWDGQAWRDPSTGAPA